MLTSRVPFFVFVLMVCLALMAAGQAGAGVQAERGTISVKQTGPGEVGIRYLPEGSVMESQFGGLYFVVQHEDSTPRAKAWSGRGRLFYSDRMVAVLGEDGTRVMYKLADSAAPESLGRYGFKALDAYGIAVYRRSEAAQAR
jgi:hypothetical protein